MEEFFILIIIVLVSITLYKLVGLKNQATQNAKTLNKHIITVYKKVETLEKIINAKGIKTPVIKEENIKPVVEQVQHVENPIKKQKTITVVEPEKVKLVSEKKPEKIIPIKPTPEQELIPAKKIIENRKPTSSTVQINTSKTIPKTKKTDWEKLIGENLLNKIGIGVLVIGIGFFVKYAIDQNWIGNFGRVAIGIGVGTILIAIAHFMRKKYKAFSSVLIGGGISVLYYTISIAYTDYHIFNQPVAFSIMTIITIFSVVLAIIYNKKEIAIIGIIGGFTSPFMVAGETENYQAFFTYIAILNAGMLALSYFKKWNIIQKLAYGFTILFFGGWLISHIINGDLDKGFALIISSVFYIQFLGTSLLYNIKHKLNFNAFEFIQILSVNALYLLSGLVILNNYKNGDFKGGFTFCLALFNLVIYFILKMNKAIDKNLSLLFIGKSVTFLTLAILIQFDAHYATLFWAIEAVILLWMSQQSKQKILKVASLIVTIIATFGLFHSWVEQLQQSNSSTIFDSALISHLGIITTYIASILLLNKEAKNDSIYGFPLTMIKNTIAFWAYIAFYITIIIKINIHLGHIEPVRFAQLIQFVFTLFMICIGLVFTKTKKTPLYREVFTIVALLAIFIYITVGNLNVINMRNYVLNYNFSTHFFLIHFIAVALIIYLFYLLRKISFEISDNKGFQKWVLVILSVFGVTLASIELDHIAVFTFFEKGQTSAQNILHHTQREGYTTLWGVYSLILMVYGMRKKNQHIRILALSLLAITLLKLFIFDIREISKSGKIIAFISLGILLLLVSFLYQKLKTKTDEDNTPNDKIEEGSLGK